MIETQGNKGKKTSKYGGKNKLNYEHEKTNASILQIEILRDRRIFVYFHLNKGGQYRIRSPPDLKFELKNKYKEITYVYKRLETEIFGDENNE